VVYDRYKSQFLQAGFDKWVPEGVRLAWATDYDDGTQQRMDGYDADHWMDMQLTLPGFDFDSERAPPFVRCALYHTSGGQAGKPVPAQAAPVRSITIALKNLSHGLVNNVNRSHSSPMLNACGSFIPTSVSIPVIRNKTVLHICDAVQGLCHGGPILQEESRKFIWKHKRMYFSTDPVALDRIGWEDWTESGWNWA